MSQAHAREVIRFVADDFVPATGDALEGNRVSSERHDEAIAIG
jgi:hypothetical protein